MADIESEYRTSARPHSRAISLRELTAVQSALIPKSWVSFLSVEGEERLSAVRAVWDRFRNELPESYELIQNRLLKIDLVRHYPEDRPLEVKWLTLIYTFSSDSRFGEVSFEAGNPIGTDVRPPILDAWKRLPQQLVRLYDFHDGFYNTKMRACGFVPREDIMFLAEEEWGILTSIETPSFDMKKTLAVFYLPGGASYLCLDLGREALQGVEWYSDIEPTSGLDFWRTVDSALSKNLRGD